MKTLSGRVVRGDGVGRRLGYPTANLKLPARARPPRGVWRVTVSGPSLAARPAVCNVGVRPTLGGRRMVVEVHIPAWRGRLYGRVLTVAFESPIRAERRFTSLSALRAQIRRDVASLTRPRGRDTMNA